MAESILSTDNLDFTSDGVTTQAKFTATASTLTFNGVSGADVVLSGIATPSVGTDAANKDYVDSSSSTPGGADTNIQYNSAGSFAGSANLVWNNTNQLITVTGKERIGTTSLSGTPGLGGSQFEVQAQTFTDNTGGPTTTNAMFNSFAQPTLAASASTTTTNAATIYVAGAPITGTNQSITNEFAIWVDAGNVMIDEQLLTGGNITSSATIEGAVITDGTASLNSGAWTSVTSITATTVTGTTITDGTATLNTGTLTGLAAPTADSDAANKAYVDSIASGLNWKDPVRVGTTTEINLTGEQTIDGISTTSGDRVLVKNGTITNPTTTSVDNGIYVVATGAWSRATDLAAGSSAAGTAMFIEEGTVNASSGYVCNDAVGSDVVGTDTLTFVQFTGAGLINAGNGLSKTGNTLDVNYDDVTIGLTSNDLFVKNGGIDTTQLATDAVTTVKITDANVTNAKLANSSITVTAGDGLQSGGVVSLGGSVSLAVNSTILRTTGDQSASGIQSFTNTTQSTNSTTGAVVISGGLGIAKDLFSVGRIDTTGTIDGGTITDGTWSTTAGVFTGINSVATGSLTATGTVQGSTLTDGTASLTSGSWTGITTINASGAITGGSITDGSATLASGTLSGLVAPTADSHAANKAYVDSAVSGLQWKDPCEAGTTGNINLSSAPATIDGVSPSSGVSRILVKDQTSADENGIYIWNGTGSAMTRSSDMAATTDAENFASLVEDGTTNAGTSWVVTGVAPFIVDTDDIVWTQFASSGTVSAGDGLTKVGNTLNVNYDDVTIGLSSNDLFVKNGGIDTAQLATDAVTTIKITDANVTNAKLANSSLTVTAGDGLQNGGSVSLGGSTTLDVDTTVLRTTGNQSAAGIQSFTNTTQSTSETTGAVVISGGLGIAKDTFSTGRIDTTGIIEGGTITDGTWSTTAGVQTGAVSIATGTLTATGTVQGTTLTDGTATITGGDFSGVDATLTTDLTLSAIPATRVLFTTTGGLVSSDSALTWDGSLLAATTFDTQTITRPNDANLASLWSDGTGNIDIGLNTTGTIQLGQGPTLELTQTSSTLQSELTIQDNFSRRYSISTINTAANTTYTATQFFDGLIERDPNGDDRTDTTPTAAQLVAIVPNAVVGSSIEVIIRNSSASLESLTLAAGTGVTFNETITVAAGITRRFLVVFTNVTLTTESCTIYASVPKDRTIIQSSFTNPTSGGSVTAYAQWGPKSTAVVDATVIGFSGTIVQMIAAYSSSTALGIGAGESLAFSIGTANANLDTFTVATGGTDVIIWDNTDNGTKPSSSSGALTIALASTDRLAIRSVETGTVTPTTSEVRIQITVELD